jgi:hypothetical protein
MDAIVVDDLVTVSHGWNVLEMGERVKLGEEAAELARLISNPIEFEGIKSGVIQLLPYAQKLDGVPAAHPVLDDVVATLGVPISGDVCQGNEVLFGDFLHPHRFVEYGDLRILGHDAPSATSTAFSLQLGQTASPKVKALRG